MKSIVIVSSYHHGNTKKVGERIAAALGARLAQPKKVDLAELRTCDLIGLGSGIYDAKHHIDLLNLVDSLPRVSGGRAFLFSTDGMPRFLVKSAAMLDRKMTADHRALREKLTAKGYEIVGEFNCAGYNTNSFLKLFGGINKGCPSEEDLERAAKFSMDLKTNVP